MLRCAISIRGFDMFLKSAKQANKKKLEFLESWLELDDPKNWQAAFEQWILEQDPVIFGDYLVCLGDFVGPIFKSAIHHVYTVGLRQPSAVIAQPTALPFKKESLDWLFLPFSLAYSEDPHQLLREANYALRKDGYLLILMANPFSLSALKRLNLFSSGQHPWRGRLFSLARIKDWLELLHFQVLHEGYLKVSDPRESKKHKNTFNFKFIPFYTGYALIAQKKEWPLTWQAAKSSRVFKPNKQVVFGYNKKAT